MATLQVEVPDEVIKEFEDSLDRDMESWSEGLSEHFEDYESGEIGKANEAAKTGGVMVCFYLDPDVQQELAEEGGEDTDDLHVTLLYFGKADQFTEEQLEDLRYQVERFASRYAPLQGEIGGSGRFPATPSSDGKDVLVRLVDVPRLETFREALREHLERAGYIAYGNHGYTPHVTIAYVDSYYEGANEHPEPVAVAFNAISCAVGGLQYHYPMNGDEVVKTGPTAGDVHVNKPLDIECEWDREHKRCKETAKASISVTKIDSYRKQVFGWASVVEKDGKTVTDRQGDQMSEEDLEKAAYQFVRECRKAGEMHERTDGIGTLIESIVFTKEKQKALGVDLGKAGWWVGFQITDDSTWNKIEKGEYRSFSIHGKGIRTEL